MVSIEKEDLNEEKVKNIMIEDFPTSSPESTVSEVEKMLIKETKNFETISYVYIIKKNKLVGVLSVKDIFRAKKNKKVKNIMETNIISVNPEEDQEKAALLSLKNDLKAIPVVGKNREILGIIPHDKIMRILHKEHIEDALYNAGIHKFKNPEKEIITASVKTHFIKRLPWLVLGLVGGIIAAILIGFFEKTLEANIILAAFIPAIVYMADAVGNQTQTIFIRSLALEKFDLRKYIQKEFAINSLLGIVLGLLFFIILSIIWKEPLLGAIIGISIFISIIIAILVSLLLPIIFQKMKSDPAISSGPFATTVRDLTALLVYFGVSNLIINTLI